MTKSEGLSRTIRWRGSDETSIFLLGIDFDFFDNNCSGFCRREDRLDCSSGRNDDEKSDQGHKGLRRKERSARRCALFVTVLGDGKVKSGGLDPNQPILSNTTAK
jgi:hypothetical protein